MRDAPAMQERDAEDDRRARAYPMDYIRQSEELTRRCRYPDYWSDDQDCNDCIDTESEETIGDKQFQRTSEEVWQARRSEPAED